MSGFDQKMDLLKRSSYSSVDDDVMNAFSSKNNRRRNIWDRSESNKSVLVEYVSIPRARNYRLLSTFRIVVSDRYWCTFIRRSCNGYRKMIKYHRRCSRKRRIWELVQKCGIVEWLVACENMSWTACDTSRQTFPASAIKPRYADDRKVEWL